MGNSFKKRLARLHTSDRKAIIEAIIEEINKRFKTKKMKNRIDPKDITKMDLWKIISALIIDNPKYVESNIKFARYRLNLIMIIKNPFLLKLVKGHYIKNGIDIVSKTNTQMLTHASHSLKKSKKLFHTYKKGAMKNKEIDDLLFTIKKQGEKSKIFYYSLIEDSQHPSSPSPVDSIPKRKVPKHESNVSTNWNRLDELCMRDHTNNENNTNVSNTSCGDTSPSCASDYGIFEKGEKDTNGPKSNVSNSLWNQLELCMWNNTNSENNTNVSPSYDVISERNNENNTNVSNTSCGDTSSYCSSYYGIFEEKDTNGPKSNVSNSLWNQLDLCMWNNTNSENNTNVSNTSCGDTSPSCSSDYGIFEKGEKDTNESNIFSNENYTDYSSFIHEILGEEEENTTHHAKDDFPSNDMFDDDGKDVEENNENPKKRKFEEVDYSDINEKEDVIDFFFHDTNPPQFYFFPDLENVEETVSDEDVFKLFVWHKQ